MFLTEENQNNNENEGDWQSGKEQNKSKEPKNGHGKYVFECQRCGRCCEKKTSVVVNIADLKKWSSDVTMPSLFPYLAIENINDEYTQISLKKPASDEGKTEPGCPVYDAENKLCNIYYSMPLYCKSFPLGYDNERYFLKDSTCPGVGKGSMDAETLKDARNTAKEDFEARVSTTLLLPVLHTLVFRFILGESKKQIDTLSEEQKEKLKGIFGKETQERTGSEKAGTDFGKDSTTEK